MVYARKKGKTKITVRARNKKKYTVTVKVRKGTRPAAILPKRMSISQEFMEKLRQAPVEERINQFSIAISGKSPEEAKAMMSDYNITMEDLENNHSEGTLLKLGYKTYPISGELLKRVRDAIDELEGSAKKYSQYIDANPDYAIKAMQNLIDGIVSTPASPSRTSATTATKTCMSSS